jgi:phospholipid/cholesterol/gamma-HCH transport system permease protein
MVVPILKDSLEIMGGLAHVFMESVRELKTRRPSSKDIYAQIYNLGIGSIPLVAITALSSGFVMTLQFGLGLEKYGGKPYVPKVMSMAIFLELSPVFTALMCAARVGAGVASEIGSMKVTQQLDAIRALGTSPYQKIYLPRIIACLVSFPILTLLTSFLALFATAVIANFELGLPWLFTYQKVVTTITPWEFLSGFFKPFGFALCVALPACYFGMNVTEGTKGVGRATTLSVVTASILIFISDYFMTKIYWLIYPYA